MITRLRPRFWGLLFAALLLPETAAAQGVGTCPRSLGEAYLDVNNVRARILNNGGLFWRGEPHVYEVPKGSGSNAIFASNIWLAGFVGGELRAAGTRYGEWEFWAGPLDAAGNPPADCLRYDRLWEITREDLERYHTTGEVTENLRIWPWHLGAPVIDGDGIDGNYDLAEGDRPELLGDQLLWWVMNDRGNVHESTDSEPIGVEVHASAFAFQHPRSYIDNVTFYRYMIHYKGREPLEKTYFGIFSDPDLGDIFDDYVGSDTTLHLGYVYNSDNEDTSSEGYGTPPPALGYTFLRSVVADPDGRDNDRDGTVDEPGERLGMETFACVLKGGCDYCEPVSIDEYYHCLQGRWPNGEPIVVGGNGTNAFGAGGILGQTTHFLFPGDPTTGSYWSMENADGNGTALDPFDTRFSMSSGPFSMQPGETDTFIVAIVWARGADRLDSVRRLKQDVARLRAVAGEILIPDVTAFVSEPLPEPSFPLGFTRNHPNPFREATTIRYSLPQAMHVRLTVYDVLGREVAVLVDRRQEAGAYDVDFEAGELPAGVYLYRVEMDRLAATKTMLLLR